MKLIATLGTSPGGVLETFEYLRKKGDLVTDIVIITTGNPNVKKAYDYLLSMFSCCIKLKYQDVYIEEIRLPFDDITSEEDLIQLMKIASDKVNAGDYVDITGGRKAISMAMGMLAFKNGAKVITTIVPQEKYNEVQQEMKSNRKPIRGECTDQDREYFCKLIANNATTIEISDRLI